MSGISTQELQKLFDRIDVLGQQTALLRAEVAGFTGRVEEWRRATERRCDEHRDVLFATPHGLKPRLQATELGLQQHVAADERSEARRFAIASGLGLTVLGLVAERVAHLVRFWRE